MQTYLTKNDFIETCSYFIPHDERSHLLNRAKVCDEEGVQHGWIHIRQSVHNPNIALIMQSSVPCGGQSMAKILRDKYDSSVLEEMFST